jgi:TetR/AcrR family transcriptional regulator
MEPNTEEKILEAAREVFTRKGFAAARMQEIADTAGINKGLLHYYFRNKEKLFRAIFEEAFSRFALRANQIFVADLPLFEKIEAFVETYMDILVQNPHLPVFVLSELSRNPEEFVCSVLNREGRPNPLQFLGQIQLEAQAGRIRQVNPFDLFINMISLCVFPFVARPMVQGLMGIDDQTYAKLMENRKREIVDFIIHAIKIT